MPDEAPDRAVATVLQAIERTPQVRAPLLAPRRPLPMNRFSYAALVAALAVVIGGGAYLLASNRPSVGGPTPTPSSAPTQSPTPGSTPLPISPAADRLRGAWVADVQLGLRDQGPRIQLSFDWQDGKTVSVQTNYSSGTQVFLSDSVAASAGQLRLRSQQTADGCTAGDLGTYGWARSADGTFLTLTALSDQCAARSATLARTWVHTLNAVTDGGHGVLPVDNLELTLPNRRFGLGSLADGAYDQSFDTGPYIEFLAIKNPTPFKVPCASPREAGPAIRTAAGLVAYVKSSPAFAITSTPATIDGHAATHLAGAPRAAYRCAAGDLGFFHGGNSADWTISNGNVEALSVWITQVGPDAYLFWYRGDQVTSAEEAAVIGSIHFMTQLPTP
jgi:hypothetical protein